MAWCLSPVPLAGRPAEIRRAMAAGARHGSCAARAENAPAARFRPLLKLSNRKIQPPSISAILEDAILPVDGGRMPYRSV
jgi:hypothetical protein